MWISGVTPHTATHDPTAADAVRPAKLSGSTVVAASLAQNTWTDVDLSAIVGANKALVALQVNNVAAAATGFSVRPKGETSNLAAERGANHCQTAAAAGDAGVVIGYTDAAGILQYWSPTAANSTVDLLWWAVIA